MPQTKPKSCCMAPNFAEFQLCYATLTGMIDIASARDRRGLKASRNNDKKLGDISFAASAASIYAFWVALPSQSHDEQ